MQLVGQVKTTAKLYLYLIGIIIYNGNDSQIKIGRIIVKPQTPDPKTSAPKMPHQVAAAPQTVCPRAGNIATRETLDSRTLFAGTDEVIITHGAETYRLRLTRQNRLILTK
jgi:hemin uptake protein HemP